jgi:hypothetical protein
MGGTTQHIPVAWLDVLGIPGLKKLGASAALISSSPTNLGGTFPTTGSGLLLVDTGSHSYTTEILTAPVTNATTLTSYSNPGIPSTPVNHSVVAASGTRLVTYGWDGNSAFAAFDLVDQPGTPNAQAEAPQTVSGMGQTCPQNSFAQGADGSLLWMTAAGSAPDGGPDVVTSARLAWLLANGTASAFSVTAKVDVETYPSQPGFCTAVAGPMAWIDANTALVTAADSNDPTQTVVKIATKAQMPPSILPQTRTLSASIGQVAAAASNGFGYVLAHDVATASDSTVHIFAPPCAP